jgi:tetratricopeptide (TPR) repeat protein
MPQKLNNPDEYSAEFLDTNLEAINELATFAQIYQGFTLAFAEVNFTLDVQVLLKALKNHPRCQDVQFVVIEITDPELEFVLTKLKERLQKATIEPDKKIVIVVLGLERAIGFVKTEKTPEVLDNLNFARNVFTVQLPYPVIFVLPDYALTRLARGARDFWAWASAVIAFRSGRQTIEQVHLRVFEPKEPNRLFGSDDKPVKQERIDLLQRLLTQYQPTLGKPDADLAPLRLNILDELADAYSSLSDMQTARHFYTEALNLAQSIGKEWTQANAMFGLGRISAFFGDRVEALTKYEKALELYKSVGDPLGEANTLQAIGDVLHFLKQSQEALNRYDEALKIFKSTSNRLGEANTLQAIGDVLHFLKQSQEALNRYDEALNLFKAKGNRMGEANTLRAIGDVLQFLKQSQEALNRYEEALQLFRSTGDPLGEANTLKAIGDVLHFLKQSQEALNRYDEALQLYKKTGEQVGEAYTLQSIADVLVQQENLDAEVFGQAVARLETAYSLFCDIGDRYSQSRILLTSIAPVLLRQKKREEAIAAITKAAKLASEIGYEPMQQHAADMLKTLQQQEA